VPVIPILDPDRTCETSTPTISRDTCKFELAAHAEPGAKYTTQCVADDGPMHRLRQWLATLFIERIEREELCPGMGNGFKELAGLGYLAASHDGNHKGCNTCGDGCGCGS
jgi:hypothetical protein